MSEYTNLEPADNNAGDSSNIENFIIAAYNIAAFIVSSYMLFTGSAISFFIVLVYPLLGVALCLISKGSIKIISDNKSRISGSIYFGFLIPVMFILFKSFDDYTLFQTNNIWLPFIAISMILIVLLYRAGINPFDEKNKFGAIFIYVLALGYGYGSARVINCAFDRSEPKIYKATVINRREHTGRHNTWHLTLSPWGPMQEVREEEVDGWVYDHAQLGDIVKVNFRPGLLHVPWFVISN